MVSDYTSKVAYQILVSVSPIHNLLVIRSVKSTPLNSVTMKFTQRHPPICLIQHRLGGWCVLGHFQCYFLWGSEESDVIRHQTQHIFSQTWICVKPLGFLSANEQAPLGGPDVCSTSQYQFKKEARKVCQVKCVKFGYIWKEFPSKALNGLLSLQKGTICNNLFKLTFSDSDNYVKLQTSSEMFQIPGQFINFMSFLKPNCSAIFTGGLPFPILNCFIEPSLAISLKALVDHTKCACLMRKLCFRTPKHRDQAKGKLTERCFMWMFLKIMVPPNHPF